MTFNFSNEIIDLTKQTELCSLMNNYGSDKGNGWHNYTIFYNFLFKDIKHKELNIFEVGLGTNNTYIPSNMGKDGKPGASLYGWRDYFTNSNIYGADIDVDILFNTEKISTYYVDQLNKNSILDMWEQIDKKMDIIIDDGLHDFEANINFLTNSLDKINKGGFYIIEDIIKNSDNIINFTNKLNDLNLNYRFINIPNTNNKHDNLLILIYI